MSECTFDTCGKTTGDGMRLCFDCTEGLEYDLAAITGVLEDLGAVVARKAKGAPSVGGGGSSNPLPLDLDAMAKGKELGHLLRSWAYNLADDLRIMPPLAPGARGVSDWLRDRTNAIRKQDWAADVKQEVRDALNTCRRAADRADDRVFAGMCPTEDCGAPVYTKTGHVTARCRICTTEWDVADWRGRALEYAGHTSGTAAEISRMISDPVTKETLQPATIRQWVRRNKLAPIGEDEKGRPTYQLRKVRNLWTRMKESVYGNPQLKAG